MTVFRETAAVAGAMAVAGRWVYLSLLLLLGLLWRALAAEQLALLEVFLEQRPVVSTTLQGQVLDPGRTKGSEPRDEEPEGLEGELVLVHDEDGLISTEPSEGEAKQSEPWIAVVPVEMDDIQASTGNQESFADVVNRMKRALVLGASALIILALNQNTVTEMDVSQELSKPIIVIQTSENVTKLFGALLRGLQATVKITYRTILQDDLKYLQQLWDTVLLVALILSTGVLVQAHWQYQDHRLDTQLQLLSNQDVLKRMSSLKTKSYCQPKSWCDSVQTVETENCAVCLEPFNNNQCLRELPCRHEYHQDCVDPWLLLHHTCPLCKRSILGAVCQDI